MSSEISMRVTADVALENLKEGNAKFASGTLNGSQSGRERRLATLKEQHPLACVLGCADSRVPVEIIFDQGIGDIFTVRTAGNVCNMDQVASIEFAVGYIDVPLVVILGHTGCLAVGAVASGEHLKWSIAPVLTSIQWAVSKAAQRNPRLAGAELLAIAIEANVWQSIEDLFKRSQYIRDRVRADGFKVVGAVYDMEVGLVHWLGSHPLQNSLV